MDDLRLRRVVTDERRHDMVGHIYSVGLLSECGRILRLGDKYRKIFSSTDNWCVSD
ncbi:MAG: hypothetical protein ABI167_11555 [Nitrosospira sp.]